MFDNFYKNLNILLSTTDNQVSFDAKDSKKGKIIINFANARGNNIEFKLDKEYENWFIDERYLSESKEGLEWYSKYKYQFGEMNFPAALKYLQDNPNLKPEISDFIKAAFGICDGDVSRNRQGAKGTCHLLSVRDELPDDEFLSNIADGIVKQNDNATVTVTFFGVKDKNNQPLSFTFSNKEISESYVNSYTMDGGSTDPDDAALELGYQKLSKYISSLFKDTEKRIETLKEKHCMAVMNNTLEFLKNLENKPDELQYLYEYLNSNIEEFNKIGWNKSLAVMEKDNMKDLLWMNMNFDSPIVEGLQRELNSANKTMGFLKTEFGIDSNFAKYDENDIYLKLGGNPKTTFKLLTGYSAKVLEWGEFLPENWQDAPNAKEIWDKTRLSVIDNFFNTVDLNKTPIIIGFTESLPNLGLYDNHSYSLKSMFIDDNGDKIVRLRDPNGSFVEVAYETFLRYVQDPIYYDSATQKD